MTGDAAPVRFYVHFSATDPRLIPGRVPLCAKCHAQIARGETVSANDQLYHAGCYSETVDQ